MNLWCSGVSVQVSGVKTLDPETRNLKPETLKQPREVQVMDCIFCKIVKGEIPSMKVYEDDRVLGFMDINPVNDGHLLVIPKAHAATIREIPEADFVAVMSAVHKLAHAVQKALNPEGITLMQLNGAASNQVVPHLHVHIVPRWSGDGLTISRWKLVQGDMDKIKDIAERIRDKVESRE